MNYIIILNDIIFIFENLNVNIYNHESQNHDTH